MRVGSSTGTAVEQPLPHMHTFRHMEARVCTYTRRRFGSSEAGMAHAWRWEACSVRHAWRWLGWCTVLAICTSIPDHEYLVSRVQAVYFFCKKCLPSSALEGGTRSALLGIARFALAGAASPCANEQLSEARKRAAGPRVSSKVALLHALAHIACGLSGCRFDGVVGASTS